MDVQSHTRTHRVLQRVPDAELDAELGGSRRELEAALGRPVLAVAYPTGVAIDRSPAIEAAVRRAGYRVGFSNASGMSWMVRGDGTALHLRRIGMFDGEPLSSFKARAAFPGWP